MARVVVVGLGPAGPELMTGNTRRIIDESGARYLRTLRHPAAEAVPNTESFDDAYERADTFEGVYREIVDRLVTAAEEVGEVVYIVPGSPTVLERSVELLRSDDRVEVDVHPAISFLELAWARLGVDPVDAGVKLVDGHRFAAEAAGEVGPLLIAHCHNQRVLSDIKLSVDGDDEMTATLLQGLGTDQERVVTVPWSEVDRAVGADHLTSLYIPHVTAPVAGELQRFVELVATLRRDCPWDREQTHHSLRRHLLEESYEVVDAIDGLGPEDAATDVVAADIPGYDHLEEELGDLLFQVVFHAAIAEQRGGFTIADVAEGIHDKLYRRHPHVFGDAVVDDPADLAAGWEQMKKAEKQRSSVMDGIPRAMPALLYAEKVVKKAIAGGVSPPTPDTEPEAVDEIADRLVEVVVAARSVGIDPELTLRARTDEIRDRFASAESEGRLDDLAWTELAGRTPA